MDIYIYIHMYIHIYIYIYIYIYPPAPPGQRDAFPQPTQCDEQALFGTKKATRTARRSADTGLHVKGSDTFGLLPAMLWSLAILEYTITYYYT